MYSFFRKDPTTRLSPATCRERFKDGALMLDVRTAGEVALGRLACAEHIDSMAPDFDAQLERLGRDKSRPIYVYCQSGRRSAAVAERLRELGYSEAYNVGTYSALAAVGFITALPDADA